MNETGEIGVVVVTHRPSGGMGARLQAMRCQGAFFVVVDNGSSPAERSLLAFEAARLGGEWVANVENIGLAAALNQGVSRLRDRGCAWALLFDQDSEPPRSLGQRLARDVADHPGNARIAAIGPNFRDAATGRSHRFLRADDRVRWLFSKTPMTDSVLPVTMVITSGSLVRIAAWEAVGRFDEGLFIDYVDTDFCLKARAEGWTILATPSACLQHRLGNREVRRLLGWEATPTHHSPLRHYYIARNRVPLLRRHGRREVHWVLFEVCAAALWVFRVVAFERAKLKKLRAMLVGTWDGLCGHNGPCPLSRRRTFET